MAAGTSLCFLAISGTGVFTLVALVLYSTNYGSFHKSEFLLSFRAVTRSNQPDYSKSINEFSRTANLLHAEPSGDGKTAKLTFDILMKKDKDSQEISGNIARLERISEVVLVASKHDIDY